MMTLEEIANNHIVNNGLEISLSDFIRQINIAAKNKNTKLVRSGDVLFVFTHKDGAVFVYIINGGGPAGYLRALRSFVSMIKKLEIKKIMMRVQNTESAERIATSAGLSNISFEMDDENDVDPYVMTAEV